MRPERELREDNERVEYPDEPRRRYVKPAVEEEDLVSFYTLKCKYPWTGCDNDPAKFS